MFPLIVMFGLLCLCFVQTLLDHVNKILCHTVYVYKNIMCVSIEELLCHSVSWLSGLRLFLITVLKFYLGVRFKAGTL